MLKFGWDGFGESPPDTLNVGFDLGVTKHRHLSLDLGGRLLTKLDIFRRAVRILGSDNPSFTQYTDWRRQGYQQQRAYARPKTSGSHVNLRTNVQLLSTAWRNSG